MKRFLCYPFRGFLFCKPFSWNVFEFCYFKVGSVAKVNEVNLGYVACFLLLVIAVFDKFCPGRCLQLAEKVALTIILEEKVLDWYLLALFGLMGEGECS